MPLRIMASRHSVFYSPLIATIAAGFLERHRLAAEYSILAKGSARSAAEIEQHLRQLHRPPLAALIG
jgi:hypothetical protein